MNKNVLGSAIGAAFLAAMTLGMSKPAHAGGEVNVYFLSPTQT